MAYVTERDYFERLRGERVALVGSAASIEGTWAGVEIDSADVVVRVNNGAPVPQRLWAHAGERCDVLYHILADGRRPLSVDEIEQLGTRAGLVIATRPASSSRVKRFAPYAEAFKWSACPVERGNLALVLGCPPNSGAVALAHLLRSPARSISVYGFDCYATGHWVGQGSETPEQAAAQAGGTARHNQAAHREWFRRVHYQHMRVSYSPMMRTLLDI